MQLKKFKKASNFFAIFLLVAHVFTPQASIAQKKPTTEEVVIGYGTVKKSNLTGAVTEVNVKDLAKAPVYSFTDALGGRAAGLQVSAADGQPGAVMNMLIRNFNSLFQNNTPLFVVDGTIVPDFQAAALNPADIEAINILKDAAATAIYGANSANGVVLIQTKRGQLGKPVISFNNAVGFQEVTKKMELMSPYEFVKYQDELNPTNAATKYFSNGKTPASYRDKEGIDWQDLITRRSLVRMHNLSLTGGSSKTKYALSASNFHQEGVIANSNAKRYQVRAAVDQIITDQITVGITANYSEISNSGQIVSKGGTYYSFFNTRVWGYRPVTGSDFDLVNSETDVEVPGYFDRINPVLSNKEEDRKNEISDLFTTAYLNYTITKDLTWRSTGSYINRKQERSALHNSKSYLGVSRGSNSSTYGNFGSAANDKREYWMNDHTLTYEKKIAENHHLSLLGGFAMRSEKRTADSTYATQIPTGKTAFDMGIPNFDEPFGRSFYYHSLKNKYKMTSFFGRLFYGYKSRYMMEGSYRADKSKDDYGLLDVDYHHYAGALAWNMHEEYFLKDFSAVSSSKLRMSYGKGKERYQQADQFNIGYDLGLFNNRLALTVDVYKKTIENRYHYYVRPLPGGSGYQHVVIMKPWEVVSDKLQNKGLEFNLNTINVVAASFSWQTNFNINFNKNKILQVEGDQESYRFYNYPVFVDNSSLFEARVGQSAGAMIGYIFDGVYQYADFNQSSSGAYVLKNNIPFHGATAGMIQPGDIKFKDINGDGIIDLADKKVIGNGHPIHTGGFTNNFTYNNFDLHIFFQWSYGNEIYNANRLFLEGNARVLTDFNQFASYVNRWTPENQTNENYRAGARESYNSSRVVEDGSYLRLKTVSFAYNIPEKHSSKLYLSKLKLHITAQNLLTFTKYSGMDPEVSLWNNVLTPGIDMSAYPQARTLLFGVNASF